MKAGGWPRWFPQKHQVPGRCGDPMLAQLVVMKDALGLAVREPPTQNPALVFCLQHWVTLGESPSLAGPQHSFPFF